MVQEALGQHFKPADAAGVAEVVSWAAAEGEPLEVLGSGSKRTLGRPVQAAHVLDVSALAGVTAYEPEELVISAGAATPVAEIEALLASHNQEFAFEPMDYGPLQGLPAGQGTLAGLLATNLAGPKRLKHGAARDHVLGIQAISGRGEAFKSGGTVVKNVTGYDLPRALAGSWGTLAVSTALTFKVLPRAETEATALVAGLEDGEAIACLCRAMGTSAEVSSATHVPAPLAASLGVPGMAASQGVTLLRLEGFAPSVEYRFAALNALLAPLGPVHRVDATASRDVWQALRDVRPFWGDDTPVWRISVPPASGALVGEALRARCGADVFYDWSGGLLWVRMPAGRPDAESVRATIRRHGGHATLVRAALSDRAAVPVFEPQAPALAALSRRLKQQFDPAGILNPGRMVAGL